MTTVGEPIEPAVWRWYYDVVGKGEAVIVDIVGNRLWDRDLTIVFLAELTAILPRYADANAYRSWGKLVSSMIQASIGP
jgi:acyl-coenzyme A synthetase/AMP-(fatty) acid ligase